MDWNFELVNKFLYMTQKAQEPKEKKIDKTDFIEITTSCVFQRTSPRKWKDNLQNERKYFTNYISSKELVSRI